MQYYISWTHSDPIYHQAIPDLGVLVSPPNVSLSWSLVDWPVLPSRIIIDSGAYQYYRNERQVSPAETLNRQLAIVTEQVSMVGICHLDVPLLGTRELAELDRRVTRSLAHARWLMDQVEAGRLPANVYPIGVIQGYSVESVYFVAQVLQDMGYTSFALGSLANMATNNGDEVLRRVEAALEAVGPEIHVLGVSSVALLPAIAQLGVRSADSSAPMREAWMGGIVYSRPFRRYKIASAHFREWQRSYKFADLLETPLPCECPVCLVDSQRLMEIRGKQYVNLRALHNCYHLAREFASAYPES